MTSHRIQPDCYYGDRGHRSFWCPVCVCVCVQLWWQPLSAMLSSLWSSVGEEEPLPEKLQLITDCQHWANRWHFLFHLLILRQGPTLCFQNKMTWSLTERQNSLFLSDDLQCSDQFVVTVHAFSSSPALGLLSLSVLQKSRSEQAELQFSSKPAATRERSPVPTGKTRTWLLV